MTAVQALKLARAAGVRIGIDGDALALDADAPPPPKVIESLSNHKAEIIAFLRPGVDGWSGEDWHSFFDRKAISAEMNCGLTRDQAEVRAFECCLAEWLNRNPVCSLQDRCALCGEPEKGQEPLIPFGVGSNGQSWLHSRCWPAWRASRKAEAVAALSAFEIGMRTPL